MEMSFSCIHLMWNDSHQFCKLYVGDSHLLMICICTALQCSDYAVSYIVLPSSLVMPFPLFGLFLGEMIEIFLWY
jgi:hypothetical protein